jgi:flagellar hook assembly protein FlgD
MKNKVLCCLSVFLLVTLFLFPVLNAQAAASPTVKDAGFCANAVKVSITKLDPGGKSPIKSTLTEVLLGKAIKVYYKIGAKCNLKLNIIDNKGKTVRSIAKANAAAGTGYIQWDGKAAGGKKMAYGAFIFALTAAPVKASDGTAATAKLTVLTKVAAKAGVIKYQKIWYVPKYTFELDFSYNTSGMVTIKMTKGTKVYTNGSFIVYVSKEGTAEKMFFKWSGKMPDKTYIPAGKYKLTYTLKNGASSSTKTLNVEVRRVKS